MNSNLAWKTISPSLEFMQIRKNYFSCGNTNSDMRQFGMYPKKSHASFHIENGERVRELTRNRTGNQRAVGYALTVLSVPVRLDGKYFRKNLDYENVQLWDITTAKLHKHTLENWHQLVTTLVPFYVKESK